MTERLGIPSEEAITQIIESSILNDYNYLKRVDRRPNNPLYDHERVTRAKGRVRRFEDNFLYDKGYANDMNDPDLLITEVHNETMMSMKEHLIAAITERKKGAFKVCMDMFTKIQN